jgi:hypothetical protein
MAEGLGRRRGEVVARAGGLCEYCQSPEWAGTQSFSLDHVVPVSGGGGDDLNNLALCCQGCNNKKYNKVAGQDPLTREVAALFNPRLQRWRDHFRWSDDFLRMEGLTATGRATIAVLELNREQLVNFRRILCAAGDHPPREGGKSPLRG